jgi:ATP-dependent Clp protease ATP-binding subunit ClpA
LESTLEDKNVALIVSEAARKWFAVNGYDANMGARPMSRLVEKEIRKPLADELLFGKLMQGGTVKVGVKKDQITLSITAL